MFAESPWCDAVVLTESQGFCASKLLLVIASFCIRVAFAPGQRKLSAAWRTHGATRMPTRLSMRRRHGSCSKGKDFAQELKACLTDSRRGAYGTDACRLLRIARAWMPLSGRWRRCQSASFNTGGLILAAESVPVVCFRLFVGLTLVLKVKSREAKKHQRLMDSMASPIRALVEQCGEGL